MANPHAPVEDNTSPPFGLSPGHDRLPPASDDQARSAPQNLLPAATLPRGGGAIRGIDEKFSTNPATGTGSLTVPIATSPGRGGFGVTLELRYDSGAGGGPFGIGWTLSLPSISRRTDRGLPRYGDDARDTFVLSGSDDLVPFQSTDDNGEIAERNGHRVLRYRPRVEGQFARIEQWTRMSDGDVHWRVTDRSNVTNIYGRGPSSRIADPAAPDEGEHARVFSWLLEETRDDRGNIAVYDYKQEDGAGVEPLDDRRGPDGADLGPSSVERSRFAHDEHGSLELDGDGAPIFEATAQRYLKRVRYGNRDPVPPDNDAPRDDEHAWLFEVVFDYGEHDAPDGVDHTVTDAPHPHDRSDEADSSRRRTWNVRKGAFSTRRPGFEVRTYRLCRRVLMLHRFPDAQLGPNPTLVRSTDLSYDESPVVTYLTRVTQAGYDEWNPAAERYSRATLPALHLGYNRPTFDQTVYAIDRASLAGIESGIDGSAHRWIDLDGEGIPGVLTTAERAWQFKRNHGDGRLGRPQMLDPLPTPAELTNGAQLTDLQGDGRVDVVTYAPPRSGFFSRTSDGRWRAFQEFGSVPHLDWSDPALRFVDLDGDGHADVLDTTTDPMVWYRSLATTGFELGGAVPKAINDDLGPAVSFGDSTASLFLADMSGDGLVDLVRVHPGGVHYWPNVGHGRFGRKVTLAGRVLFDAPERFDPRRVRFGDLDGSGTSDVLYLGGAGVDVYLNESGNALSEPRRLPLPPVDDAAHFSVVDLLGSGTSCLVWSSTLDVHRSQPIRYLHPLGGTKPHLLASIDNSLGAKTRIAYAPSTMFYLRDRDAGRPWLTTLPFPVHVVERIDRHDHVNDSVLTTTFAYHHGYFDGHPDAREFRGFACVEQWDAERIGMEPTSHLFATLPYDVDPDDPSLNLPPARTVTWFHTGAWDERGPLERQRADEYYDGDSDAPLLADTTLPPDLQPWELREAARALKGSVLRQEVYAEDGTSAATHPYTVSERSYGVRRLQPATADLAGVFFVHPHETIDLHYERDPHDPRMQHELVLAVDDWGNVTRSAALSYPRRQPHREAGRDEQGRLWATVTEATFINRGHGADAYVLTSPEAPTGTPLAIAPGAVREWHRVGLPVESTRWELTGLTAPETPASATAVSERWRALTADDVTDALGRADIRPYEDPADASTRARRLIGAHLTQYLDDALQPLPRGRTGLQGIEHRSYRLALTDGLVNGVVAHDINGHHEAVDPTWLTGPCAYVPRTAAPFDETNGLLPQMEGVQWWAPSDHVVYGDAATARASFYLPERARDPFGNEHVVAYDANTLLVETVRDPVGNTTMIDNDYRILAPWASTDPNGNRAEVRFDPLGLVTRLAVMGKPGAGEGDTLDDPTATFQYDLHRQQPHSNDGLAASVKIRQRERHRDPNTRWQTSYVFSDGSGRVHMTKVQAEPGAIPIIEDGRVLRQPDGSPQTRHVAARWVASGKTLRDNKDNPVKQYEPFFSDSPTFETDPALVEWGVTPVLRYDPLGRLVRTDNPDGTFTTVTMTPWSHVTADENDTVRNSEWYRRRGSPDPDETEPTTPSVTAPREDVRVAAERRAAWLAAGHHDTPTAAHLDPLGRTFLAVEHNRTRRSSQNPPPPDETYETWTELDVDGNQLSVTDDRGVVVTRHDVDLLGRVLHSHSPDAGDRWFLPDAADMPVRSWDGRGHRVETRYDELRRLTHVRVRSTAGTKTLVRRTFYGEALGDDAAAANLRGQVYRDFDGAGMTTNTSFDFNGNLTGTTRRITRNHHQIPDWQPIEAASVGLSESAPALTDLIDNEPFVTSTTHDALNRMTWQQTPDGSETRSAYNDAGLLEQIHCRIAQDLVWTTVVDDIDYNARGQRTCIEYGNNTHTTYTYDPQTFRLRRLGTTHVDRSLLQDLAYTYDPVGNITDITDRAQQTIFFDGAVVEPRGCYRYDALYRLIEAEGREHPGQQPTHTDPPWPPLPHPNDSQALRHYTEQYVYDAVGNILCMKHKTANRGWTRSYAYETATADAAVSNRLVATSPSPDDPTRPFSATYTHDAHGNMIRMPHLSAMRWDHADQLIGVDLGGGGQAFYSYDANGARVSKIVEKGAIVEQRLYLSGCEIYRRTSNGTGTFERHTRHVMDDQRRVALIETTIADAADDSVVHEPRYRYQLDNHLGSSILETDQQGTPITYEEYHPFGTTAYHSARPNANVSIKRYRYNGKERDEATGLHYYGARYYSSWLGRWISSDIPMLDGVNAYSHTSSNPIRSVDRHGYQTNEIQEPRQLTYLWTRDARAAQETADIAMAPELVEEQSRLEDRSLATRRQVFRLEDDLASTGEKLAEKSGRVHELLTKLEESASDLPYDAAKEVLASAAKVSLPTTFAIEITDLILDALTGSEGVTNDEGLKSAVSLGRSAAGAADEPGILGKIELGASFGSFVADLRRTDRLNEEITSLSHERLDVARALQDAKREQADVQERLSAVEDKLGRLRRTERYNDTYVAVLTTIRKETISRNREKFLVYSLVSGP